MCNCMEKSYQHILQNLKFCVPRNEWNYQNLHFWVNSFFKDVNGFKYWFRDSFVNVCRQGSSEAQNEIIIARSPRDHYSSPHVSLLYFSVSQEMCSLSVKCVTLTHSLYEFIHPLVLILLALKETLRLLNALQSFSPSVVSTLTSPSLSQHLSLPRSLSFLSFCVNSLSMTLVYRWRGAITGCHLSPDALVRVCVCVWDMFVRARHISFGWWWGICERVCVWRWGCMLSDAGSRVLAELRWWL